MAAQTAAAGSDVASVHHRACDGEMPRATRTVATARPSGTLCSPDRQRDQQALQACTPPLCLSLHHCLHIIFAI